MIRKVEGSDAKAYCFTWPLLTKADGSKFGKTADSNPFARRGMAKFVLILFHLISHWKSYSNATEALFLHCNEDKVSLFEKLGFVHIKNVRDKNVWPNAIKRLHPVIGIIASDIRKFKLQAMRIDKAIDGQLKKRVASHSFC